MSGGSNKFWLLFAARFSLGFTVAAIGMLVFDPNGSETVISRNAERP